MPNTALEASRRKKMQEVTPVLPAIVYIEFITCLESNII
jgi:hypothetical protein